MSTNAPGRYCIATCYCGECPHYIPLVRRPRRYQKVTVVPTEAKYTSLPAQYLRRMDPDELRAELLDIIAHDITTQPRNVQKAIGPSEVGSPCARKVGYGMLQIPPLNPIAEPNWKAYVGQGVHLMLAGAMDRFNVANALHIGHAERFYIESKLQVGEIGGVRVALTGHCDVYDRVTRTVIDWKTCGPSMHKHYKANGPGETYRSQGHLYGRGWSRYLGLPVDRVMLMFFPRQGELRDTHAWSEPYDEQVALSALYRVDAIDATLDALGPELGLAALPAVEDYCGGCDWFFPGGSPTGSLLNGCPGALTVQKSVPALTMKEG